jgi:hypothetical protein
MTFIRGMIGLTLRIVLAFVFALAVALVIALFTSGGFHRGLFVGLLVAGLACLLLAPGGGGTGDFIDGTMVPNMPAWTRTPPGGTKVNPGVLFALAGILLIVVASVLGR